MFNTKPIPTLNLPTTQPRIPTPKRTGIEGFTPAEIMATGYGGVIRAPRAEPWEAEVLLVKAWWEGHAKFYIVYLPKQASSRPLGRTTMNKCHMLGQAFETQHEGLEAFTELVVDAD